MVTATKKPAAAAKKPAAKAKAPIASIKCPPTKPAPRKPAVKKEAAPKPVYKFNHGPLAGLEIIPLDKSNAKKGELWLTIGHSAGANHDDTKVRNLSFKVLKPVRRATREAIARGAAILYYHVLRQQNDRFGRGALGYAFRVVADGEEKGARVTYDFVIDTNELLGQKK